MSVPPGEDRVSLSESEEDSLSLRRKSAPLYSRGVRSRRFSRDETGRRRDEEPAPPGTEDLEPHASDTNGEKRRNSKDGRGSGEKRRRRRSRSRKRSSNKEVEDIFPPGEAPAKIKTEPKSKDSRPRSPARQRSRRSKSKERSHRSRSRDRTRKSRDRSCRSKSRDRPRRSRSTDRHRRSLPLNVNNGSWRQESAYERTLRQEERKHQEWKKKSDDFLAKLGIPATSIPVRPVRPPENTSIRNTFGQDLNSILNNIGIGIGKGPELSSYPPPTEFSYNRPRARSRSPLNGPFSPPPERLSPRLQFSPPDRQLSPFHRQFSAPCRTYSPPRQFSPLQRQFSSPPRRTSPQPPRPFSTSRDYSPPPRQFSPPRQYSPLRNCSPSPRRFSNSPPPSQFAQLFSSLGGYNKVSAPPPPTISTQDIDFRKKPSPISSTFPQQPAVMHRDPDTLPHGNYLVASWDVLTVGGGLSSSIYQIGCFLPHGLSYVQCVLPEEGIEEAKENTQIPLLQSSGAFYVQHPVSKQLMACCSEKVALTKFLMFLERGRTSTRPAYDGVLLVSHILESIPLLLKVVKKHKMEDAFFKTAKGFGDLCTFMAQNHSRRFIDEDKPTNQMNLSLNVVYKIIFGRTINLPSMTCDGKAQASYEILVNLLDDPPNYQNFMKTFVHPPQSAMMTKLASYRTIRERMELFRPLERYISRELAEQQVELLVTGMYAPSGSLRSKKIVLLEGAPEKNLVIKEQYSNRVSALNKTTKDLMERLGAWDLMTKSRVNPVNQMIIWESCSDAKISFQNDDSVPLNYLVENDATEKALTEVMKECGDNLTVMYGSKVKSYKLPNVSSNSSVPKEPVQITLDSGELIETQLLVGADGFNSLVRKSMGCQYMDWQYQQMGIVATLELAQPCDNHTAWQRFLPTGPIAILPLSSRHSSLVWSADTPLAKHLMSLDEAEFVDRLNHGLHDLSNKIALVENITAAFGQLLTTVSPKENYSPNPPVLKSAKLRAAFPFGFGHSTRYCGPRCVLIGDAAHRVHPLAGQGVNLGFGDVEKLVEVLEASVVDGAGLGHHDYLRDYETCRQQHNVPTMLGIDSLQKLYNTSFPPAVLARSLGLQATNAILPLKRLLAAHAAG